MSLFDHLLGKEKPRSIGPSLGAHITPEFANLLDASGQHLAMLTQLNQEKWHFGQHKTWNFRQDEGLLCFTFADGVVAECPAQAIGSHSQNDSTWFWAWGNASINPPLKQAAEHVRRYGEEHKFPLLTTSDWQATMDDAWAMTAASVMLTNASGAYCGQMGPLSMFFAFAYPTLDQP